MLHGRPQAILLSGPAGMGKTAVAEWLAASFLGVPVEKLTSHPHVVHMQPEAGKAISIETVRQLEHILSLQIPGKQVVSRVIIISHAHTLTIEAQNALLKTLEEPPIGTVIVLTSSQQDALLATIRSRLQTVEITRPDASELKAAVQTHGVPSAKVATIVALSSGLPGLAFALADDDQTHPLVAAAHTARQLLQQSSFEKLCQVDGLAKNKEASGNLIYILTQMAHAALITGKGSERWQKIMAASYEADVTLSKGGQPKLVLTNLMLNL
jgi:DNA polymerase-3 subunit delta'